MEIDCKHLQALPYDIIDRIYIDVMRQVVVQEMNDTEMHGHDERVTIIKSIKRLYESNQDYWMELDEYLRNELVTHGFGPGEVFEPLIDALRNRLSWRQLCKVKPPYESCGYGIGGVYNMDDLDKVLRFIQYFHPGIPINGWGSDNDYESDDYYNKYIEFEGTYARK